MHRNSNSFITACNASSTMHWFHRSDIWRWCSFRLHTDLSLYLMAQQGSDPEKHSLEGLRSRTTVFLIHVLRSYRCFFLEMLEWCRAFNHFTQPCLYWMQFYNWELCLYGNIIKNQASFFLFFILTKEYLQPWVTESECTANGNKTKLRAH